MNLATPKEPTRRRNSASVGMPMTAVALMGPLPWSPPSSRRRGGTLYAQARPGSPAHGTRRRRTLHYRHRKLLAKRRG